MAEFYVKSEGLDACAVRYGKHTVQLMHAQDRIRTVRNKLSGALWEKSGLRDSLKKTASACGDGAAAAGKMGVALSKAANLYSKCERGIIAYEEVQREQEALNGKHEELLAFVNDPYSSILFIDFNRYSEEIGKLGLDDALLLAVNNGFGLDILIGNLQGKDYETEVIKKQLAQILCNMEERKGTLEVPDEVKLLVEGLQAGAEKGLENADDIAAFLAEAGLKEIDPKILKQYGDILDKVDIGLILESGEKGVQLLQYALTDYRESIKTLEAFRQFGEEGSVNAAVDDMIALYQNKFIGSLQQTAEFVHEKVVEKGAELAFDAMTGGLYSAVDFGTELLMEFSGLSDTADAKESLMGNAILEYDVSSAYSEALEALRDGSFTEADVDTAKRMFEMQKSIKIAQYENLLTICDDAPRETKNAIKSELEFIKSLQMDVESIGAVKQRRNQ